MTIAPLVVRNSGNRLFLFNSSEYLDLDRAMATGEIGSYAFLAQSRILDGLDGVRTKKKQISAKSRTQHGTDAQEQQPPTLEWQRYALDNGEGYWWHRESDGDFFLESDPGQWVKYKDPTTDNAYWWRDEKSWFW